MEVIKDNTGLDAAQAIISTTGHHVDGYAAAVAIQRLALICERQAFWLAHLEARIEGRDAK